MNLREAVIAIAILSTLAPVVAACMHGRSRRTVMMATLLTAGSVSLYLALLWGLVAAGSNEPAGFWVRGLVASAVLILWSGYLLSLCFGGDNPGASIRASWRTLVFLGIAGVTFLSFLGHGAFVTGFDAAGGRGTIYLGYLGKAYLSYLLIGIVLVGYNLEKTYRVSSHEVRVRMRLPLLGIFALLGFFTFILATGMLYSSLGLGKLIASGLPIAIASLALAYGYVRGSILDVRAPVSRNVVYSSFTALAAGLLVLSIGVAAQVATLTDWSPDEILVISFGFLAVLLGVLLLFSNRFKRRIRRYIDRNFYVNRYDYRTQWSRLTEVLENAHDRDGVLDRLEVFLGDVFAADDLTLALRSDATRNIRVVRGKDGTDNRALLDLDSPLADQLLLERKALLLDRKTHDFTYIPIYAENRGWLDATASQIISPLLDGEDLVGTVGLARRDREDPFTFEDVALLDSMSAHLAAALRSLRLSEELAESREAELISQWASMILHDLKNYLSPLRMATENMLEYHDNPEAIAICARDIGRVTGRMEELVHRLSELREHPELGMRAVCANEIVRDTLSAMQTVKRNRVKINLELKAEQPILGDRAMLRRVMENLITNGIEAMDGAGTLSISTADYQSNGKPKVRIRVADTGCGMPEDFLRDKLFRPFATTKKRGLGIGLYQCRSIIQTHGGELTVESRRGEGSTFQITLSTAPPGQKSVAALAAQSKADKVAT
ncbi:MAG: PEP-CTERM system histidine kinase PrsK [Candidatus Eisenbacteria sp.]|nr:PEP-CTERM system histidine kinase PrsK [Candidatus Eisenbacteria bacterium]